MRMTTLALVAAAALTLGACSQKTQDRATATGDAAVATTSSAASDTARNVNTAADRTGAAVAKADRKADAAADAAAKQK